MQFKRILVVLTVTKMLDHNKGSKIVAQIVYEVTEPEYSDDGNVMGVDLGMLWSSIFVTVRTTKILLNCICFFT